MPRRARTFAEKWQDICNILQIPEGVFVPGENVVFCTYCSTELKSANVADISRHTSTQIHLANEILKNTPSEPSTSASEECGSRLHILYYDMAEAFMAANIPFEKLNDLKSSSFLENYMRVRISDSSSLRKTYTNLVYEKKIQDIRDEVGDNPIYLMVDETNDLLGRCITHAIIALLLLDRPGISRIINCDEISVGNANNIVQFVQQLLRRLWPDAIKQDKVLSFISDAAQYMVASGGQLRNVCNFVKIIHVTCLAHGMHRVAEEIRNCYGRVNEIIAETKAVFVIAPARKRLFHQMAPNIPLPPQPVITRWDEWLKAASYYSTNFREVQRVIRTLEPDAVVVERAQVLWEEDDREDNFQLIHQNYRIIRQAITCLEKKGTTLENSIEIVRHVENDIINNEDIPDRIKLKIRNVLNNNTGFTTLKNISSILQGEENHNVPAGWTREDMQRLKYAPITSSDIERSFSGLKHILVADRNALLVENLKKYATVYFNQIELVESEAE